MSDVTKLHNILRTASVFILRCGVWEGKQCTGALPYAKISWSSPPNSIFIHKLLPDKFHLRGTKWLKFETANLGLCRTLQHLPLTLPEALVGNTSHHYIYETLQSCCHFSLVFTQRPSMLLSLFK